jgi:hypothetical protein
MDRRAGGRGFYVDGRHDVKEIAALSSRRRCDGKGAKPGLQNSAAVHEAFTENLSAFERSRASRQF